jgi:hypothetical protein
LIILRGQFEAILQALQKRIADPHTPVRLTTQGLELSSRVEVLEGTVETQQIKADVLASAVAAGQTEPQQTEVISQTLFSLKSRYIGADSEPDDMRRIQIKNDLARSMGAEVLRMNIDRQALVGERDEVMTLALAAAVTALPQPGDDVLILTSGKGIGRLHVRYRVAAAISELAQSRNLQLNLVPDVMKERGLPLPVAVRAFMLGVSTSSTTMGGPKWKRTTARRSWAWTCTGAGRCW